MNPLKMPLLSDSASKKLKVEGSSHENEPPVAPSEASTESKDEFTPCASDSNDIPESKPSLSSQTGSLPREAAKDPPLLPQISPYTFSPSDAISEEELSLTREIRLAIQFPPTERQIYIDKTPLIDLLVDYPKLYISGPRRFGKSMALKMINQFISKASQFDWNQEILSIENSNTSGTKKQYLIMDKEKYKLAHEYLYKQFHVLFLNFSDLQMDSFDSFFKSYLMMLKDTLEDWKTLIVNDSCRIEFQDLLDSILNMNKENCDAVKRAAYILRTDIRKTNLDTKGNYQTLKVAILIDDFDSAFIEAMEQNFLPNFGKFIEKQFKIFKNSDLFQLLYFTGVRKISSIYKSEIQSKFLSDLTKMTVFSSMTSEFFGFSENDVDLILKWTCEESFDEVKTLLKKHYDGYCNQDNNSIYNPYSIAQALCHKKIDIYWTCSDSTISSIEKLFSQTENSGIEKDLGKLLGSTEPVSSVANADESSNVLKMPSIENKKVGSKLLELGLVTRYKNKYFIPNLEVRESIIEYINRQIFNNENNLQDTLVPHLINQKIKEFFISLKEFFSSLSPNFNKEYSYQLSMFILLSMYKGEPKDMGMEGSGGSGRYDLRIDFPGKKIGYIFELKLIHSENFPSLEDFVNSAEDGLDQIKSTRYRDYYLGTVYKDDIDFLFTAGVAFYQKSIYVVYKKHKMTNGVVDDDKPVETGHFNHTEFE